MRLVLADRRPLILAGMQAIFDSEPDIEVVAAEPDGVRALAAIETLRPDVAVLDLDLIDLPGLEIVRRLKQGNSPTRAVAFTLRAEPCHVLSAFEGGFIGYVLKSDEPEALVMAARYAFANEVYLGPCHAGLLMQLLGYSRPKVRAPLQPWGLRRAG